MVFGCADSEGKMFLMSIIVGTIGIFFCIFSCFVVCKHPAFQKGGEFYRDPNDVAARPCAGRRQRPCRAR